MKKWFLLNGPHRLRNGLLLAMVIFITGWLAFKPGAYQYSLNDREKVMVTSLLQHPETRYFGFYSVALPAEFTPAGMVMFIQGSAMTPVETKRQYYPPFRQFLTRYEEKLRNTSVVNPQDAPYLKEVYQLEPPLKGTIFERNEEFFTPDFARMLDAWKWTEGVTFSVKVKANDGRSVRYDGERYMAKYSFGYDVPQKKSQLLAILSGLQPRQDNQRPSGNQLAIQYGQVDASLLGQYETSINYQNSKEVTITLKTDNHSYTGTPLLDKDARVVETEYGETLYKGKRKVNGLEISEWWTKQTDSYYAKPAIIYNFELVIHQDKKEGNKLLELSMDYTVDLLHTDNALTENELVALWENITETIKHHPSQWQ
ncbi:T6SS immunity protein Tli4 family protein [Klebsiella variicola]|uniref:T6SS immunity protein Tli4 family protein n=1 Tax=Klebsiella variicola TaxID=244366 RepID=UPI001034EE52|nr:T6SS immunity protein Tli4 family protein [Klebsiella variicola]MEB6442789.1 T6SS immunity protein Tli4 family protein [Klebsiella variicola]